MTLTSSTLHLRACCELDIPAIQSITGHYVDNTVITLALTRPSYSDIQSSWQRSTSQGLPYLVAVEGDQVLGFGSIGEFRGGGGRGGYRHTVELSLFCHPDHLKRGIGSMLLRKLIEVLSAPERFPDMISTPRAVEARPRMLLACMSVDETTQNNGLGLRDFYVKHGFEEVGHMKKVGHKLDRWVDTRYLQLQLW